MCHLSFTAIAVQTKVPLDELALEKQNIYAQANLWLQVAIRDQVLTVRTVKGDGTVADLMTKHLASPRIYKLLDR